MSALIAVATLLVCIKADNEIVSLAVLCIAGLWGLFKIMTERSY